MSDTENYLKPKNQLVVVFIFFTIILLYYAIEHKTNLSIEECVIETWTTQYFNWQSI